MNQQSNQSFADVVNALPTLAARHQSALQGCAGTYRLTTKEGHTVDVTISPGGQVTFAPIAGEPDVSVTASEGDLMDMLRGKLNPAKALLFGRVKVRGAMGKLMSLVALVK